MQKAKDSGKLFEFGNDMFSVGELAESGDVRADTVEESTALFRVAQVDELLNDVVGVCIAHHRLQSTVKTHTRTYICSECVLFDSR